MNARYFWPFIVRPFLVIVFAAGLLKLVAGTWWTRDVEIDQSATQKRTTPAVAIGRVPAQTQENGGKTGNGPAAEEPTKNQSRDVDQISVSMPVIGIAAGLFVLLVAGTTIIVGYRIKRAQADSLRRTISELRLYGDAGQRMDAELSESLGRLDASICQGPGRAEFERLIEAVERQSLTIKHIFADLPRLQPAEMPPTAPAPLSTGIEGDVAHQVFHEYSAPWDLITPRGDGGSAKARPEIRGGFALPSGMQKETEGIRASAALIEFPGPGIYALHTHLGPRKILILDVPPEDDRGAERIVEFLAAAMIEGGEDGPVFYGTVDGPDRLTNKLFRSDMPVVLHSLERCLLAARVLAHEGLTSRILSIEPNEQGIDAGYTGHHLLEVYLYEAQRWSLFDLHFNVRLTDVNDRELSMRDIYDIDADRIRPRPFAPIVALKPGFDLQKESWSQQAVTKIEFDDYFQSKSYTYSQMIKNFTHRVTYRNPRLQAQHGDWLSYGTRICDSNGVMLGPEAASPMLFDHAAYEATVSIDIPEPTWSGGHCYTAMLPENILGDSQDNSTKSEWFLVEDNRVLARRRSSHETIRLLGRGRYSHWSNALYFSASDNSSPLSNNRKYRIVKFRKTS